MQQQGNYWSSIDLVRGFQMIHPQDFHGTKYFFESNEHYFDVLNPEGYFPILVAYVNALFELGDHRRLLPYADRLIELSVVENLQMEDGEEDIFTQALFFKAYSLLQLKETEEAVVLSRQLLSIAPEMPRNAKLYRLAYLQRRPNYLRASLALGVISGIVYLVMLALVYLLMEPFYPSLLDGYYFLMFACFVFGTCGILFGTATHLISAWVAMIRVRNLARKKALSKKQYSA